jgi:undecaprenyl phosphate-alpha-L-ara4N flippase subunit ArnE
MNSLLILLLVVIGTLLSATGMLFLKFASRSFRVHISLFANKYLYIACFLYALSLVAYIMVLKNMPISIAYALTSMNYVWAALLSKRFLGEKVDAWRWGGIALIIVGITLLAI